MLAKYPLWIRSWPRSSGSSSSYNAYFDVRYVYFSIHVLAYHVLFVNRTHGTFTDATDLPSADFDINRIINANMTVNTTDEIDRVSIVDKLSGICSIHRTDQNESLIRTNHSLNHRSGPNKTDFQLCRGVISYKNCVQPTIDQLRRFSEDVAVISEITDWSIVNNSSTFPITINCCQGYELRTNENGTRCSAVCSQFCLDGQCTKPNDCASCQPGYGDPICTAITPTKHLMICYQNYTSNNITVGKLFLECGSCGRCAIVVTTWLTLLLLSAFILVMALRERICCHPSFVPLDDHSENETTVQ